MMTGLVNPNLLFLLVKCRLLVEDGHCLPLLDSVELGYVAISADNQVTALLVEGLDVDVRLAHGDGLLLAAGSC